MVVGVYILALLIEAPSSVRDDREFCVFGGDLLGLTQSRWEINDSAPGVTTARSVHTSTVQNPRSWLLSRFRNSVFNLKNNKFADKNVLRSALRELCPIC